MSELISDQEALNSLIRAIGLQARRDYIDARLAIKKGTYNFAGQNAFTVVREIEEWLREMLDYEEAENSIEKLRRMTKADRADKADLRGNPCKRKRAPDGWY